jgi:hypothetical protein
VAKKIAQLAFHILRNPDRAFPFQVSDHLSHRILRRDRYQEMHMVWHQMSFVKYNAEVPPDLPKQQLLAVLRRDYDMVLALPCRVVQMITIL